MNKFDEDLIAKYIPIQEQEKAYQKLEEGYPVQYLIGNVEFFNQIIDVNENVLIPRFETEYLVDYLLYYIRKYNFIEPKILDIGTGSGCIAIALKKTILSSVTALDISKKALELAKKNAEKNGAEIAFIEKDIKDYNPREKYDIIVSNPPYVSRKEIVDPKTKYEPQNAVFAKESGLYFYRIILEKSKKMLCKKNIIAFETGAYQHEQIISIAKEIYPLAKIISQSDLNGYDRYIFIINE